VTNIPPGRTGVTRVFRTTLYGGGNERKIPVLVGISEIINGVFFGRERYCVYIFLPVLSSISKPSGVFPVAKTGRTLAHGATILIVPFDSLIVAIETPEEVTLNCPDEAVIFIPSTPENPP
jgi:hypothetical protein